MDSVTGELAALLESLAAWLPVALVVAIGAGVLVLIWMARHE